MVPIFQNTGNKLVAKNVQKKFQKLVNNRLVDHLEKCDLLSNFQHGFWFFYSTSNLLSAVSDGTVRAFNGFSTTEL